MSSALGVLKWSPDSFWAATFYEYTAAMKGHLAENGVDTTPPPSTEEFYRLKAETEKKRRMRGN